VKLVVLVKVTKKVNDQGRGKNFLGRRKSLNKIFTVVMK